MARPRSASRAPSILLLSAALFSRSRAGEGDDRSADVSFPDLVDGTGLAGAHLLPRCRTALPGEMTRGRRGFSEEAIRERSEWLAATNGAD